MKIIVYTLITLIIFSANSFLCIETENTKIVGVNQSPGGIWKSRREWKAHWVKQWEIRKIYVPVWKKIWGPVEVKEWIPFPAPPPPPPPPPAPSPNLPPHSEWNSSPLRH